MTDFRAEIDDISSADAAWTARSNGQAVTVSEPVSVGGSDDALTPEHLFALSLLNCYVATFRVIAEKSDLTYESMKASITTTLDTDTTPPLKEATITLTYHGEDDAKTKHVARKARDHCYVHQSVRTDITISFNHV